MRKVAFITGITGQDGSYLSELLLEKKYIVYGIVRRTSLLYSSTRIDHIRDKLHLHYGDLTDNAGLLNILSSIVYKHPDMTSLEIYNLGAQSHVQVSFELPEYTSNVDALGILRILEVIRSFDKNIQKKIKLYQAGTSEMFGEVLETPQNEQTPFNPKSPYAVSKVYAHYMMKVYREGYNLFLVNGILFNHESPRRGANFVTMKVINGIKDIMLGKKQYIELGNLDSKRDWGHTKDFVRGMWLMLQRETPKDFVLATGNTHKIRTFVEKAFHYKGMLISWEGRGEEEIGKDQNGIMRVKINSRFYRPCEVDLLLGDPTQAEKELGWKREYDTLDKIIEDMFD